jgi:hypothetical protein
LFANNLPSVTGTIVGITSFSGACNAIYVNEHFPRSSVALSIQLASSVDGGPAGPVTAPGAFELLGPNAGPNLFGANWDSVDASCRVTTTQATAGSLTISTVSPSQLTGSFDLMFGADHVTGSFTASNCQAALSAQGNPSCS